MSNVTLHVGDVHEVLATLPDNSVDLVVTSPPFLALRSYLPADHPDKAKEIGGEPNPGEFIDALLDVVEACDRVLTPHGSICIELGDTYSGARGYGKKGSNPLYGDRADERLAEGRVARNFKRKDDTDWPEAKSLCLIPELFRLSLSYGRNPLTGRETPRWKVRNVVRWHRTNPPVGALSDKFRPSTSDMVIACKSRTRWFDLHAVRTPHKSDPTKFSGNGYTKGNPSGEGNPNGAPPLDTWIIPTASYKGSHYAVFPPALVIKPILSMCPERVCRVCGEPSRRITQPTEDYTAARGGRGDFSRHDRGASDLEIGNAPRSSNVSGFTAQHETLGWTDCGHDDWRPGVVLDPFAGTGTTLAVAAEHGRDAVGIDLDSRNVELVRKRVEGPVTVIEQSAMEEVAA